MSTTQTHPDLVPVGEPPDAFLLALPDEWVIDPLVTQRLFGQLRAAPSHIVGVATGAGPLPPGSSYRVHAERMMLQPRSALTEQGPGPLPGAVLLRRDADVELSLDGVVINAGSVLVDHGTHAYDPWQPYRDLHAATVLGRPPFPSRPVVLVVVGDPDEGLDDWARRLVNDLVRLGVEARLAIPAPTRGLHLTHPALPNVESFRALAPDVVLTVDDEARSRVAEWIGGARSGVVIDVAGARTADIELVPWRVGQNRSRLRARVGRNVDAAELRDLVNRLLAGPFPIPALRPTDVEVELRKVAPDTTAVSRRTRTVAIVAGVLDTAGRRRVEGLVDHLEARGHKAEVITVESTSSSLPPADVVILRNATAHPETARLVDDRRRSGQLTLVDVAPSDVLVADDSVALTAEARALLSACGHAITPSAAVREQAIATGARVLIVPTLLSRPRAGALKQARSAGDDGQPVIGWFVGTSGHPAPEHADVVAKALRVLLAEHDLLRIDVVGDPGQMPASLISHPRAQVLAGLADSRRVSTWAAQVWTPAALHVALAGDLAPYVDASYVAVPTVLAAQNRPAIDGYVHPDLVVCHPDDPEGWADLLRPLLVDPQQREHRGQEAVRRIEGLFGGRASTAVIERFLGWLYYRGDAR